MSGEEAVMVGTWNGAVQLCLEAETCEEEQTELWRRNRERTQLHTGLSHAQGEGDEAEDEMVR